MATASPDKDIRKANPVEFRRLSTGFVDMWISDLGKNTVLSRHVDNTCQTGTIHSPIRQHPIPFCRNRLKGFSTVCTVLMMTLMIYLLLNQPVKTRF